MFQNFYEKNSNTEGSLFFLLSLTVVQLKYVFHLVEQVAVDANQSTFDGSIKPVLGLISHLKNGNCHQQRGVLHL